MSERTWGQCPRCQNLNGKLVLINMEQNADGVWVDARTPQFACKCGFQWKEKKEEPIKYPAKPVEQVTEQVTQPHEEPSYAGTIGAPDEGSGSSGEAAGEGDVVQGDLPG